ALDGDMLKFTKILRGRNDKPEYQAPLGKPGINVKEGEYLVSIDGQKVGRNVNPATLLVGKAGKLVTIQVSSSMTGENPRTL
ncbi:PDZ domain-containing protein, partial [Acinetobacter baumannii]